MKTFMGYKRPDGRVGIRNNVLILPASVCASDTTRIISDQVKGTVTFNNQLGCSQVEKDLQYTMDVMSGFAANPNIYGTIIVSLGCENAQMHLVKAEIEKRTNKPVKGLIIQEEGGTLRTIEKAVRLANEMVQEASLLVREECDLSEIVIGTECGGSDPTSGLASNPLVGNLSDKIVELGGTMVLSETTEFIGAEHILARRAKNEDVKNRLIDIIRRYEKAIYDASGEEIREGNPSPGNKVGGLTTLEEKSLGCIHKGGTSIINEVYDYAKDVKEKGLVVMDTPGNDPSSVAGMIAGGCQIVLFTTGRGTPTGNPIAPVFKITGNKNTYEIMKDNLDFNASPLIHENKDMDEMTEELFEEVLKIINGKGTKAELLGYKEMAIMRAANFV